MVLVYLLVLGRVLMVAFSLPILSLSSKSYLFCHWEGIRPLIMLSLSHLGLPGMLQWSLFHSLSLYQYGQD